jgi:hypothetical protein
MLSVGFLTWLKGFVTSSVGTRPVCYFPTAELLELLSPERSSLRF